MPGVSEFRDITELCWLHTSSVKIEEVLLCESVKISICTGMFRKKNITIRSMKLVVFMNVDN